MTAALAYGDLAGGETHSKGTADAPGWRTTPDAANAAPRCGARTRHRHGPCPNPFMANGRCRMRGSTSTGPPTAAGRERSPPANWRQGARSAELAGLLRGARDRGRRLAAPVNACERGDLPGKATSNPMHPDAAARGRRPCVGSARSSGPDATAARAARVLPGHPL